MKISSAPTTLLNWTNESGFQTIRNHDGGNEGVQFACERDALPTELRPHPPRLSAVANMKEQRDTPSQNFTAKIHSGD